MNRQLKNEGFRGLFLHKATGEVFALKVVPVIDPEYGHSHILKNETHTRSCTEKDFNEQFERMG